MFQSSSPDSKQRTFVSDLCLNGHQSHVVCSNTRCPIPNCHLYECRLRSPALDHFKSYLDTFFRPPTTSGRILAAYYLLDSLCMSFVSATYSDQIHQYCLSPTFRRKKLHSTTSTSRIRLSIHLRIHLSINCLQYPSQCHCPPSYRV